MKTLSDLDCCLDSLTTTVEILTAATAAGNATLVAGTVDVADTRIKSTSVIVIGRKTIGGTVGNGSYTLDPGVGFTINSSNSSDTSVMSYFIKY